MPAARLGDALTTCRGLGAVTHESQSTEDVTEQYFDLEARLENARRLEARLLELLESKAASLTDVIEVEHELAAVRETIERFEGNLRLWSNQVAFSTIRMQLTTRDRYTAMEHASLGGEIAEAFNGSVRLLGEVALGLLVRG